MTRSGKISRPPGNVYERLSQRLEEFCKRHRGSHAAEEIDGIRRDLFGCLPDDPEPPQESSSQNEEIYPAKSG
jgi:hypothetical protein